jgi:hypothetical protein
MILRQFGTHHNYKVLYNRLRFVNVHFKQTSGRSERVSLAVLRNDKLIKIVKKPDQTMKRFAQGNRIRNIP